MFVPLQIWPLILGCLLTWEGNDPPEEFAAK